jgi:predicted nucleic acid-binding protein
LVALLESASVLMHPFIVGEIACGSLKDRNTTLVELLQYLPTAAVAEFSEVLSFVEHHQLWGQGIGYVDVHLLAAVALTHGATLWTRDKRLLAAAQALGCAFVEPASH